MFKSLRGAVGDEAISENEIASGTSCPRKDDGDWKLDDVW